MFLYPKTGVKHLKAKPYLKGQQHALPALQVFLLFLTATSPTGADINMTEKNSANLLPYLSPICPKNKEPNGLEIKPAANTPKTKNI